ncbi:MAG: carotenoid biosynthesis protein [Deltaproteobacteria bacterium]|nr:carotenoid biosynthesis protein [Deltaproteobacteria bacterium]
MVFGVPFWDSLSYPFMIFAGYATAEFILGMSLRGVKRRSNLPNALEPGGLPRRSTQRIECSARNDIPAAFLGAILTMLLDIIIDPLTVLGDKWFLGKVYYYPNGGQYFGVPLTNFAGWFLVPLMVIIVFQLVMSFPYYSCHPRESGDPVNTRDSRLRGNDTAALTHQRTPPLLPRRAGNALTHFFNPLFYLAIALFNIAITMWIGETLLASIDCMLLAPVIGLLIWRIKSSLITSH